MQLRNCYGIKSMKTLSRILKMVKERITIRRITINSNRINIIKSTLPSDNKIERLVFSLSCIKRALSQFQ